MSKMLLAVVFIGVVAIGGTVAIGMRPQEKVAASNDDICSSVSHMYGFVRGNGSDPKCRPWETVMVGGSDANGVQCKFCEDDYRKAWPDDFQVVQEILRNWGQPYTFTHNHWNIKVEPEGGVGGDAYYGWAKVTYTKAAEIRSYLPYYEYQMSVCENCGDGTVLRVEFKVSPKEKERRTAEAIKRFNDRLAEKKE